MEEIVAVGKARTREPLNTVEDVLATCIRHARYCDRSLARNRLWSASYALHRLRMELMNAFGQTHGGVRGWITFEELATPQLQERLAKTVALHDEPSIRGALLSSIDILEYETALFVAGHSGINADGRYILRWLRERVTARAWSMNVSAGTPKESRCRAIWRFHLGRQIVRPIARLMICPREWSTAIPQGLPTISAWNCGSGASLALQRRWFEYTGGDRRRSRPVHQRCP